ncbi:MAG: hypothetical protein ACUVQV_00545 [Dissulfurimicrobium sp.]|uniref:hypothetical protein n=1 Tax=Dissulfurimicrobium sp. TaxID=2022436 RepID=UPI00404B49B5
MKGLRIWPQLFTGCKGRKGVLFQAYLSIRSGRDKEIQTIVIVQWAVETIRADVKGYRMKELEQKDDSKEEKADSTESSSSGVQWAAAIFGMMIVVFIVLDIQTKKEIILYGA